MRNRLLLHPPSSSPLAPSSPYLLHPERSEGSLRLTLASLPNRQRLTLDLSIQERACARDLIDAAGASLWFMPTCSPDFDPIEHACSRLSHHRRPAAADTRATVQAETQRLWPTITAANTRAYFTASGYTL